MSIATYRYDSADYLDTDDAIAGYAEEMMAEDDPALLEMGVGVVLRAQELRILAETTGLSRDAIVAALTGEDPNGQQTLRAALVATSRLTVSQAAE